MDKILFAILTCNRFHYLRNCLDSIVRCVDLDRIKIVVCDNNTVEKGFDEYVNGMSEKHDSIRMKKFTDRTRNELYRAMNWAIKHARKRGYKIINFIQDDYQYLFPNDAHLDEVQQIFKKHKKIAQVNYNLVWRRKKDGHGKIKHFDIDETHYAIFTQKRMVDNGFTRVDVYKKTGLYPTDAVSWGGNTRVGFGKRPGRYAGVENGEVWFGRECLKRGYQRAISLFPNMGMVFDCAYVRGEIRMGDYFPPPNQFYLKPFDEQKISDLRRRHDKKKFSFIEDMCEPDGWKPKTMDKHSPLKKSSSIYTS